MLIRRGRFWDREKILQWLRLTETPSEFRLLDKAKTTSSMTYFVHFTGAARACWMWMRKGPRCLMYWKDMRRTTRYCHELYPPSAPQDLCLHCPRLSSVRELSHAVFLAHSVNSYCRYYALLYL